MNDDAGTRQRLFRALEEILGLELASALMTSVPPHDWSRLATKDDLDELRLATRADIDKLRRATKADIDELRQATQADIAELRSETRRDIAELRKDMTHDLSVAVLRLESAIADQSASFERALRTELSKQSRAAVAGMVGMAATIGGFVVALLNVVG